MNKFFKNFDLLLFLCILLIAALNLVIIFSIRPDLLAQQTIHLLLGFSLFFLLSLIDYNFFSGLKTHLYLFCLFFLLLTLFLGNITRGAIRWIQIFNFSLQPSELTKPLLILFFAQLGAESNLKNFKNFFFNLLLFLPLVFLVFIQPSLGNAIIFFLVWLAIILSSGVSFIIPFLGFISILLFSPLFWYFLKDYQRQRLLSFLNPQKDPLGAGYNLIQSVIAAGSGMLLGRGLGGGTQSHLKFLPERHNDFIFASFAEEFGFLGTIILIILYFILLLRILKIAQKTEDNNATLICLGVFSLILCHLFINIGMNLGLLPITGITLPLFSSGGSSLVAIFISLGLVESISRRGKTSKTIQIS